MPRAAPLPRRAMLGARLPPDAEAFSAQGMRIKAVVPAGMAALAGVKRDDTLVKMGGVPLTSLCALGDALRRAGAQEAVELVIDRQGERLACLADVQRAPAETIADQRVSYESLEVDGVRLRTIVTSPRHQRARGAILCVQGIACETVDGPGGTMGPLVELVRGWAAAGYVTMRMDKRGVADSEGGPCGDVDFETERRDFRAAARAFCADSRTESLPLLVFGHSIGGMHAPLLDPPRALRGIIVSGSSTARWLDCVEASTRRQLALRGATPTEIQERLASLRAHVARDGLNGRSAEYHRQLDSVDLTSAWKQARARRLLVLRGEYDWVVSRREQEALASLVASHPDAAAAVVDLPGLDHLLGWHPSSEASLASYGAGTWNRHVLDVSLEWMHRATVDFTP